MSEIANSTSPTGSEQKKSGKTLIIVVAVLAFVLATLVVISFIREGKMKATNAALMTAYGSLDSISNELDSKITQIEQLGGNIQELTVIQDSLQREKDDLLQARTRSDKQIKDLKSRVEGYRELLVMKDVEIQELKKVNENLVVENSELKTERNELNQDLRDAKKTQDELSAKVQIAAQLEAENIVVAAIGKDGKAREDEFRARQIDQLSVKFSIAKNDVAPVSGKVILMRIIDDNGNVLFDIARGSGTFDLDGKETFYTSKQEILFDNTQQTMNFLYNKGSEYLPGHYTMQIYTEGYLMGSKSFRVK